MASRIHREVYVRFWEGFWQTYGRNAARRLIPILRGQGRGRFLGQGGDAFVWLGAYDITADELLAGTDTGKAESKTAQAEALILDLLANGKKMPSAELEKAVNDRGISSRTLRTAKARIGSRLVTEKNGASWVCYLRA